MHIILDTLQIKNIKIKHTIVYRSIQLDLSCFFFKQNTYKL